MKYTIMLIAMPQSEVIKCSYAYANTDAEAMEYAMIQPCFTDAQDYIIIVNDAAGKFSASVQGTRGARNITPDTV